MSNVIIGETDNSAPTVVETFAGIPAAIIGTSKTGPAFVPTLVNSELSFTETFGDVSSDHWGSVAVRSWYSEAQANAGLVYLRVLGVGDGKKRTTNNRVANAGFVVGSNNVRNEDEKVNTTLSDAERAAINVGALEKNPFANETDELTAGVGATATILVVSATPGDYESGGQTAFTLQSADGTSRTYQFAVGGAKSTGDVVTGTTIRVQVQSLSTQGAIAAQIVAAINDSDAHGTKFTCALTTTTETNDTITVTQATVGVAGNTTIAAITNGDASELKINDGIIESTFTGGIDRVQAQAAPGRTYFLSTIMSESAGSTYLTDAGLTGTHDPILRAVILVASGVQLQVSGWRPGDSGANAISGSHVAVDNVSGAFGHEDEGNWIGAYNKSTTSVKLILNGLKDSTARVIDFNLDPDVSSYLGGINTEIKEFENEGHYLYAHYPVPSTLAVPAQTDKVIHKFSQKQLNNDQLPVGDAQEHFHNVLLTTGSSSRNQYGASGYKPNYEGWEDRFSTPFTPWVISQPVGGTETKLFRLHALDDGQGTEDQYFAEICNIIYPSEDDEYAVFDLKVRRYGDASTGSTVTKPLIEENTVLKSYTNLTLDPNDSQYIARVIGDNHRYYNFDVNTDEQKLVIAGMYENTNKYFRVEVTSDVSNGKIAKTLVPFGFQGMHHLVTSGSSEMLSDIQAGENWYEPNLYGEAGHTDGYPILSGGFAGIGQGILLPPVPFRFKTKNTDADETLYPWGIRFDRPTTGILFTDAGNSTKETFDRTEDLIVNNSTDMWANGSDLDLIRQLNKFYPSYSTSPMWVGDNAGVANTANGAVLDSNEFNKNKFSLGRVYVAEDSSSHPDATRWHQAYYIRNGSDPSTSGFRFLKPTDLKAARLTQNYTRFVLPFQGGFDGLNIFNKNNYAMNHWSAHFEQQNSATQGGLLGSTVAAHRKAIDIIAEKTDVDINALAIPGQRSTFITDHAANKMEERFDAIYIMDVELTDQYGSGVANIMFDGFPGQKIDDTRSVNTSNVIERFASRGLKNSFSAAYYPNVNLDFKTNSAVAASENIFNQDIGIGISTSTYEQAPASIAAIGAFARTERLEGAWGVPAGYTNGRPASIENTALQITGADSKELAVNAINPIVVFNDNVQPQLATATDLNVMGTGFIVGQRTLLNTSSALSRLDVRKLMVYIRRKTRDIAYKYIFEPNQPSVLSQFSSDVENLLTTLVTAGAVAQYRVVIDETTTSQADIENNTVRGKVFVQPYRSVEIIAIDININNSDQA